MQKVMLIYPPSGLHMRGEDRCQSSIEDSTSTAMRACNDLGYVASALKASGYSVFLKDYQTENKKTIDLKRDIDRFRPDVLFLSSTNTTILEDLKLIDRLKDFVVIIKSALFFDAPDELLKELNLENMDYLIGGECEFIISRLLNAHFAGNDVSEIPGIIFKQDGKWKKTDFSRWETDLDKLRFPDRGLMNNKLYVRPDTGEVQATISTSRGCPASCIYCLTPTISGKKLRNRSPENILEELKECCNKYNIKNFFFKSDTFTMDAKWVQELCNLIIDSGLKIQWVANSRTKPLDIETLKLMKKAGCWLISFGFESGSSETLQRIKKGATLKDSYIAAKLAKKAGLKIYGFYMVGFPWENMHHLRATKKLMMNIDADFVELHIATPFYGTELYEIAKKQGMIDGVLGKDYFSGAIKGTKYLSIKEILDFRKKTLLRYHLRPKFILKHLDALYNPKKFINYAKYGFQVIKNSV